MARFLKFKFLFIFKLNFNGGQFYKKKTLNFDFFQKICQNCIEIKFEIENVDFVRQKLWVENSESKILSDFKLKKPGLLNWWVNEWMGGIKLNYTPP